MESVLYVVARAKRLVRWYVSSHFRQSPLINDKLGEILNQLRASLTATLFYFLFLSSIVRLVERDKIFVLFLFQ